MSVSQRTEQQSPPAAAVGVASPAVAAPAPTGDPQKIKSLQQHLLLLLHAHKCQIREKQSNGKVRQCYMSIPQCRPMKNVLRHMTNCYVGKSCKTLHCSSSRQIITHWRNCTDDACPICVPIKEASKKQQQADATVPTSESSEGLAPADVKSVHEALGLPLSDGNGSPNINPVIQRSQTVAVLHVNFLAATVTTIESSEGLAPADVKNSHEALGLLLSDGNVNSNINPVIQRSQTVAVPHGIVMKPSVGKTVDTSQAVQQVHAAILKRSAPHMVAVAGESNPAVSSPIPIAGLTAETQQIQAQMQKPVPQRMSGVPNLMLNEGNEALLQPTAFPRTNNNTLQNQPIPSPREQLASSPHYPTQPEIPSLPMGTAEPDQITSNSDRSSHQSLSVGTTGPDQMTSNNEMMSDLSNSVSSHPGVFSQLQSLINKELGLSSRDDMNRSQLTQEEFDKYFENLFLPQNKTLPPKLLLPVLFYNQL